MSEEPELEEWQAHVKKEPHLAYCGAKLWAEFALVDADHARRCVEQDNRTQPCPKCWAEIQKATP